MQARRLPAERGTFWLLEGFRLFRRNPPLITALTLTYLLVVQALVLVLPGLGPLLLPLLLPALTLIVANGCRLVDEGRAPGKDTLLKGLTGNGPAMLQLGGLQLAGAVLLVLLNLAINAGADPLAGLDPSAIAPNMGEPGAALPADLPAAEAAALGALLRLLLLALPVILAFWFAPFLVGWDRVSPFKAVFFSTIATWRNWRAFGMFALGSVVVAGIVPGLILILASQIAGVALSVAFVAMRMLLVFLVAPVLTASIYVSYRDIFHPAIDTNA
jgi:hypothetical protein